MSTIKKPDYFSSRREMEPAGNRNKAFPFKKLLDWDSSCRFNVLNSYRKEKQKKHLGCYKINDGIHIFYSRSPKCHSSYLN